MVGEGWYGGYGILNLENVYIIISYIYVMSARNIVFRNFLLYVLWNGYLGIRLRCKHSLDILLLCYYMIYFVRTVFFFLLPTVFSVDFHLREPAAVYTAN